MSKERDEALRNKMSKASVEDLFSNFDENIAWQAIEAAIAGKPVQRKKLTWLPAAAALIIGLLIGFAMKKEARQTVVKTEQVKVPIEKWKRDTVYVPAPQVQTEIAKTMKQKVPDARQKTAQNNSVAQQKVMLPYETPVERQTEKAKESITPDAPPVPELTPLTVVYFDELKAGKDAAADKMLAKGKKRNLIKLNKSEDGENDSQELPIRNLIMALNK